MHRQGICIQRKEIESERKREDNDDDEDDDADGADIKWTHNMMPVPALQPQRRGIEPRPGRRDGDITLHKIKFQGVRRSCCLPVPCHSKSNFS